MQVSEKGIRKTQEVVARVLTVRQRSYHTTSVGLQRTSNSPVRSQSICCQSHDALHEIVVYVTNATLMMTTSPPTRCLCHWLRITRKKC